MTAKEMQKALKLAGFDPGPIDGYRGTLTISAVRAFQGANNLDVDGIVGRLTSAKLFQGRTDRAAIISIQNLRENFMPWFIEAKRLLGLREVGGKGSNPTILRWAERLKIWYPNDGVPWCGLFVAQCISSQLRGEALPANLLGARNWLKFGKKCKPQPGAVMVFWRGKKSGWSGHVGFYISEDAGTYHVLGGNQSNAVTITKVRKNRFLGARWPKTAMAAGGHTRTRHRSGTISTNEA
ncbi:MAG: TIGR02594 family protein [Rhizobiales bacterium]|nr:TIGR02594 family protein [Hyphomicrobiales bacterium]